MGTRDGQRRYVGRHDAAQIRTVLKATGSVTRAAETAGVSLARARLWRQGDLPEWFVEQERRERAAISAQRAARFLRPQDARAGR